MNTNNDRSQADCLHQHRMILWFKAAFKQTPNDAADNDHRSVKNRPVQVTFPLLNVNTKILPF